VYYWEHIELVDVALQALAASVSAASSTHHMEVVACSQEVDSLKFLSYRTRTGGADVPVELKQLHNIEIAT
jgi:hypothetical protein